MIPFYSVGQGSPVAPETIAVLGLEVVGTMTPEAMRVAQELTSALRARAAEGPYAIAPHSAKELVDVKILHGCPDMRKECAIKIARALHAAYLLYGHVERKGQAAGRGRGYQVALQLFRGSDGQLSTWKADVPGAELSGARLSAWARRGYDYLLTSVQGSRVLVDTANQVFWQITQHKPGQRLDMADPRDRAMSKTWLDIYGQVRGHRDRAAQLARRVFHEAGRPYVLVAERRDGSLTHQELPDRSRLEVMYEWRLDQPTDYTYLAMFDFTQNRDVPINDQFALSKRPSDNRP